MVAKAGYMMSIEVDLGSGSWTTWGDARNVNFNPTGGAVPVGTHRHIDGNDVAYERYIFGKRDFTITGSGILHDLSKQFMLKPWSGDANDYRFRLIVPNFIRIVDRFILDVPVSGEYEGAIAFDFTMYPSATSQASATPNITYL